jgi:REP element-mobilizing transposase RayT
MDNFPLAYLLTWTCYGTWLHGDHRGSVDRRSRGAGDPALTGDQIRWQRADALRKAAPAHIEATSRGVIEGAISTTCELRGWDLLAVNVRSNHVHVVVSAPTPPEEVMRTLKAWCTRTLRESGLVDSKSPMWTRGGSTRYLWKESDVAGAWNYVTYGQGATLPGSRRPDA